MTRRRYIPPPPQQPDAFAGVLQADEVGMADDLRAILEAVKDFDQGSVKGILFQRPVGGQGPYKWIDEVFPPFDLPAVFADLKDRFGGGDFEMRVYAAGKIRKVVNIPIAKERERAPGPAAPPGGPMSELMAMMFNQAAEARRDQAAASERQMNMFLAMGESQTKLLAAVLPALAGGGGGKASETVALITALQDRREGGGLKDTLEAMAAFKALFDDRGGQGEGEGGGLGFDPDNLVESGARLLGPAMKAIADYVARQRDQAAGAAPAGAPGDQAGDHDQAGPALHLAAPASRYRVLNLVRLDVVYMFERGHDPQKAADLIYDVIEAHQVTAAELEEIAATFALSPTGLDNLAAEGIDLRARPEWAAEFFAELLAIHTGETDDRDGDQGRAPDVASNGAAGAERVPRPTDS